jgi:hypothetical protein
MVLKNPVHQILNLEWMEGVFILLKKGSLFLLAFCFFVISACGVAQDQAETPAGIEDAPTIEGKRATPVKIQADIDQQKFTFQGYQHMERTYLPLERILDFLDYVVMESEDGTAIQAGFTDILHEVEKDSNRAIVFEEERELTHPVVTIFDDTYITSASLQDFLGEWYIISMEETRLSIRYNEEVFDFEEGEDIGDVEIIEEETPENMEVVSAAQADRIIRTARRYINTPYRFGASTNSTRYFDCSSFTQRAFGTHGISLPRTSRSQAKIGRRVTVNQLRKGDLVFFYWPGRYSSNRIVGHVGIYIGNGRVIHATPRNGVHIVNAANSSYWRRTYLGARRVG